MVHKTGHEYASSVYNIEPGDSQEQYIAMTNRSGERYSTKGFRLYKAINMGINSRVALPNMQYEKPVIIQIQESCQQTSIGAKRRGG